LKSNTQGTTDLWQKGLLGK
jgi:hypothetical protein